MPLHRLHRRNLGRYRRLIKKAANHHTFFSTKKAKMSHKAAQSRITICTSLVPRRLGQEFVWMDGFQSDFWTARYFLSNTSYFSLPLQHAAYKYMYTHRC